MSTRTRAVAAGAVLLAIASLGQPTAAAQSLEQQYAHFLSAKCTNMGFERDEDANLLPGQAGPELDAFCSGLPIVQGGSTASSASNGVAGAGPGSQAAMRRQTAGDDEDVKTAADAGDTAQLTLGGSSLFVTLSHVDEDQQAGRFEAGQRARTLGVTLGFDRRLGAAGLLGVAARAEDLAGDFDAGGDFSQRSYTALFYGSWMPSPAMFLDFTAGAALRELQTRRLISFVRTFTPPGEPSSPVVIESIAPDIARSDLHRRELQAELQWGYDVQAGAAALGPRVALAYRRSRIEATVESGTTPMALMIDAQAETSLRTALGLQASRMFNAPSAVLVVQLNADWWHEFEDDQRTVNARLAQDLRPLPSRLTFQNEPPDRDVFTARASLGVTMRRGWSAFAAFEALLGHSHLRRYGATAGLRREF